MTSKTPRVLMMPPAAKLRWTIWKMISCRLSVP
jgi:hypothetical protein